MRVSVFCIVSCERLCGRLSLCTQLGRCFVAVVEIEADRLTSCSNRGGRSPTKGNCGKTVR